MKRKSSTKIASLFLRYTDVIQGEFKVCVPTKKVLHKLINYGACSMREGDTYTTIYDIETRIFCFGTGSSGTK